MAANSAYSEARSRASITIIIVIGVIVSVFQMSSPEIVHAGVEIDSCVDSQGSHSVGSSWEVTANGTTYRCKCTKSGSKCSPSSSNKKTGGNSHNFKKDLQMQLMQGVLQSAIDSIFAVPDNSANERLKQEQEMERIAEEQRRNQALLEWKKMQSEDEAKRNLERQDQVHRGQRLLSQMQPVGGGMVEPFRAGNPKLDMKPISQNTFSTSKLKEFDRLMCSAYFSNLAKKATIDQDARFYADQVQLAMSGQPTYLECKIPQTNSAEMAQRIDAIKKTYEEMDKLNTKIQGIEARLTETKDKIAADEAKKEQLAASISELNNRAAGAPPEEKNEIDLLLMQAKNQEQELDQKLQQEKQTLDEAQKEKELADNEINSMEDQFTNR